MFYCLHFLVLGQLSELQFLDLGGNALEGTIPTAFGQLSALVTLDLSGNADLTGYIPSEFERLVNLVSLKLGGTSLTGEVPEDVCELLGKGVLEAIEVDCEQIECYCGCVCV
jgi:hypothetical protein